MAKPLVIDPTTGFDTELPAGQYLDMLAPSPAYIDGLYLSWNSSTSLSVSAGAAAMPDTGKLLVSSSAITVTSTLTGFSQYIAHCYLYNNAGTPAIEIVTTAPAAPYSGFARAKTGNTSRRYLGSVLYADSTTKIISFVHTPGEMAYRYPVGGTALQILVNGRATTTASVNCAVVAPASATHVLVFQYNDPSTSATVLLGCSDGAAPPSAGYEGFVAAGAQAAGAVRLDSSQAYEYAYQTTPAGSAGYTVRVNGYRFVR